MAVILIGDNYAYPFCHLLSRLSQSRQKQLGHPEASLRLRRRSGGSCASARAGERRRAPARCVRLPSAADNYALSKVKLQAAGAQPPSANASPEWSGRGSRMASSEVERYERICNRLQSSRLWCPVNGLLEYTASRCCNVRQPSTEGLKLRNAQAHR